MFTLIRGHFNPIAGIPDGDSVRFIANDINLWSKLEGRPVQVSDSAKSKGTVQLRFEGIDAIEKGAIKPLSVDAKINMLNLIGFDKDNNPAPEGYILARMTDDKTRRPICFVFSGSTKKRDGSDVYLDAQMLQDSVNYQQMKDGFAYPLYYNTLFASLRNKFDQALADAQRKKHGYWPHDKTSSGVIVRSHEDLKKVPPIWPKLWRRLDEYLRKSESLDGFINFLEKKNERIDVLSIMEERGLQDIVEVNGNKVKLTERPENLRVVGKAGRRNR